MSLELNLRFKGRDSVSVHFKNSDSGELTFTDPLTAKDHADIRWYVETYGAHSLGDPDDAEAARVKALLPVFGPRLFDAVFHEDAAMHRPDALGWQVRQTRRGCRLGRRSHCRPSPTRPRRTGRREL